MVAAALGAASWVACVGSDPATGGSGGPATGDRLGACFPDGKCKEGLECRLPERICLTPGEPLPADAGIDASGGGSDGGAPDGAAEASTDGGGGSCILSKQAPGPGPYCDGKQCLNGKGCCASAANVDCNDQASCNAIGGAKFFGCDGPLSCNGAFCCLDATASGGLGGKLCAERVFANATYCTGNPCEAVGKSTVCTTTADCNGQGSCVLTEVELAPDKVVVWGRCVAP